MFQTPFNQQQQQSTLPADPMNQQVGYLNITLGNPPYVPTNVPGRPEVVGNMPLISAACAMEIQQKAASNPLRMFMFNLYANNAFANEFFHSLLCTVVDYVELGGTTGQYRTVEQGIQDAVPRLCEMFAAIGLRDFPALAQAVDQQTWQAAQAVIQDFDHAGGMIRQMRQQQQQPQTNFQNNGVGTGFNQGRMQPASWSGRGTGQQSSGGGMFNRGGNGQTGGRPSVFGRGDNLNLSEAARTGGAMNAGRYNTARPATDNAAQQPFHPRQVHPKEEPMVQTQQNFDDVHEPVRELASSGKIKWKPSEEFPYLPAFNPETHDLYFIVTEEGKVLPDVQEKEEMDYDRHATGASVFGGIPKNLMLDKTTETLLRIKQGVEAISGETKPAPVAEGATPVPFRSVVDSDIRVQWNLQTAWLQGQFTRVARASELGHPEVYRIYAQIADPSVGAKDETDYVRNFHSSTSYSQLGDKLRSGANDLTPELWANLNNRMTAAVNRILRLNLGFPALSIDNFALDIEDLIEVMGKKGNMIKKAFFERQAEVIFRAIQTLDTESGDDMRTLLINPTDFAADDAPKITWVSSYNTLTYLDARSHELGVELAAGQANQIDPALTPELFKLADELFKEISKVGIDKTGPKGDKLFDRHLLRTTDGRVLELTQGWLSDECYLLTLVE